MVLVMSYGILLWGAVAEVGTVFYKNEQIEKFTL